MVSTPFHRLEGLPGMVALKGRFEPTNVSKFTVQNDIMPSPELCQVTLPPKEFQDAHNHGQSRLG